jgi:hypothetical protein
MAVTILQDMSDQNETRRLIMSGSRDVDSTIQDRIVMQGLRMKPKKPKVSEILGDAHPFSSSEEMEALKQYIRISRGQAVDLPEE